MCNAVSFFELLENGVQRLLYLTNAEVDSERGAELRAYMGSFYHDDVRGHGALCWYHDKLRDELIESGWRDWEIDDFSSPNNFPPEIAAAIRDGKFSRVWVPSFTGRCCLLTTEALCQFERVQGAARRAYGNIIEPAADVRDRRQQEAHLQYLQAINQEEVKRCEALNDNLRSIPMDPDRWAQRAEIDKVYRDACGQHRKPRDVARVAANSAYESVAQPAHREQMRTIYEAFWSLFADVNNRQEAWR